jgi:hypothetical protein
MSDSEENTPPTADFSVPIEGLTISVAPDKIVLAQREAMGEDVTSPGDYTVATYHPVEHTQVGTMTAQGEFVLTPLPPAEPTNLSSLHQEIEATEADHPDQVTRPMPPVDDKS